MHCLSSLLLLNAHSSASIYGTNVWVLLELSSSETNLLTQSSNNNEKVLDK